MPLPPHALDPARLPGRINAAVVDAAITRPRRLALLVVILLTIAAVPALLILLLTRLQGDRR